MSGIECTTGAYWPHRNIFTKTDAMGKVIRGSPFLTSGTQQGRAAQSLHILSSGRAFGCLLGGWSLSLWSTPTLGKIFSYT